MPPPTVSTQDKGPESGCLTGKGEDVKACSTEKKPKGRETEKATAIFNCCISWV